MSKLILIFFCLTTWPLVAQVSISETEITPDPSALLEVRSTSGGVLLPRLSGNQILAMPSKTEGLMVYHTDLQQVVYYNGTEWMSLLNDTVEVNPEIGASYQGGTVVYVDGTGEHGTIVSDVENGPAAWGCVGTTVGASSTSDGTANSATILADACSSAGSIT